MLVAEACPTLCKPIDCRLPDSSVHGIFQARILEWVAIPFSRGSSRPRDQTQVSCISRQILYYVNPSPKSHQLWFSHSVISNSASPRTAARQASLSPIPRACSNSYPLSWWCHPTISPSVVPFSCLQSFPAPESFPTSQFFTSGGQSIGASASASVLPMNIQDWFSLGLMGLICPCHPECGQSRLTLEAKSHIYVLIYNIYFSLSDFPHCLLQALGSSTSLELTQICAFLWLSNIPRFRFWCCILPEARMLGGPRSIISARVTQTPHTRAHPNPLLCYLVLFGELGDVESLPRVGQGHQLPWEHHSSLWTILMRPAQKAMLESSFLKWVPWTWGFFADVVDFRKNPTLVSSSSPNSTHI